MANCCQCVSIGVIVDTTQNYSSAFYSCAAGMVLGAVFLSLVRPCKVGLCHCSQRGVEQSAEAAASDLPDDFIDMDIGKGENSGKGESSGKGENSGRGSDSVV